MKKENMNVYTFNLLSMENIAIIMSILFRLQTYFEQ